MEKLNEYLQTLLSTCSYELHLEPNKTPYIVSDSGATEVANAPLLGTQISTLIFPMIPASVKQALPNRNEVEFIHKHNLGNFNFNIKKSSAGFNVTIRPLFLDGSEPSAPLSETADLLDLTAAAVSPNYAAPPADIGITAPPAPILSDSTNRGNVFFDKISLNSLPQQFESGDEKAEADYAPLNPPEEAEAETLRFGKQETAAVSTAAYGNLPLKLQELAAEYTFEIEMPIPARDEPAERIETRSVNVPGDSDSALRERMNRLFYKMSEAGASDLHLSVSVPPMIRQDGAMRKLEDDAEIFTPDALKELLESVMPAKNREEFAARRDTDFAYEIEGLARFRANVFMDRKGMGAVFRIIPTEILTAEQLGLSKAIMNLCALSKGLVVVTGPTGSGKSTTLCAMIDSINKEREDHIITIEDPIEFVHENRKCLVNQREVHNHTGSFKDALRAALREDPDILLVGEMRDLETISIAIETAETGHLVFGTLHTTTAASTVDRIIDQFPADRQQQIRVMLAESLKGVVAQTLLPKRGGGRVAALEVLIVTPAISNLIREGKTFQIASAMQTGKVHGMILLNDALFDLVKKGLVEPRHAYAKAIDKTNFEALLTRNNMKI